MASEQQLQRSIAKLIETKYKGYCVVTIETSRSGTPDIICCVDSHFIALEIKLPGREATLKPLQQAHIDLIRRSNGIAHMVTSTQQVESILDHLLGIETEFEV